MKLNGGYDKIKAANRNLEFEVESAVSIYFYGCTTIDGYLADRDHHLDWLYQTGTVEETDYEQFYEKMDITIMGRRTFDEIKTAENAKELYPTTQNYVFTHAGSLSQVGFTAIETDIVNFVKGIDKSKNIWIIGGNTILEPLLNNNMVDHMIIQIAPVLLGAGIPLFTQKEALRRFQLKEVKQYGQFAEMTYEKR